MARSDRDDSEPAAGPSTQVQRDLEIIGDGTVDPAERAKLREELRQRQQVAEDMAENPTFQSMQPLTQGMKANDRLFRKVKHANEGQLDAKTLALNSLTAQKISKIAKNEANAFDVDEILKPLRLKLGLHLARDEDVDMDDEGAAERMRRGRLGDWEAIGWMAARHSRRVFGVEFMYGPLAIEHKKRTINRKQKQKGGPKAPAVQPSAVAQEDLKQNENETVKNVRMLEKHLVEIGTFHPDVQPGYGVPFFQWFINPTDFGQSVENLFYTSFMVKDNTCVISVDDETGEMYIAACAPPDPKDYEEGVTRMQVIMELTEDAWRDAIEQYDITETVIPTRDKVVPSRPRAGGWY